jgi:hypothetical protein
MIEIVIGGKGAAGMVEGVAGPADLQAPARAANTTTGNAAR